MLISYTFENLWNFKDRTSVALENFRSSKSKKKPPKIPAVSTMAFIGGNGDGKTNALKVLLLISDFAANSCSYEPGTPLKYETCLRNREASQVAVEFTDAAERRYCYEAIFKNGGVMKERIAREAKEGDSDSCSFDGMRIDAASENEGSRWETLVERDAKKIVENRLGIGAEGIELHRGVSIVSALKQAGVARINVVYDFFAAVRSDFSCYDKQPPYDTSSIAKLYWRNSVLQNFALRLLSYFWTSVKDIRIDKSGDSYLPVFIHKNEMPRKKIPNSARIWNPKASSGSGPWRLSCGRRFRPEERY